MAEGFITRRGAVGAAPLEINGQEIISGEYAETIAKFDTVFLEENFESSNKLNDPSSLANDDSNGFSFSKDGNYAAFAQGTSPFVNIYKRDGNTFTKLPNPSTLPTGFGLYTQFSNNGNYLVVAHANSPFITIYKRDGDNFNKLPNPSVLPANVARNVAFSKDDQYMAIGNNGSPGIIIYKRNGDTFNNLTTPANIASSAKCSFSPNNEFLAVGWNTSGAFEAVRVYKNVNDVFTKIANVGSQPTTSSPDFMNPTSVDFSPDGNFFAVSFGGLNQYPRIRVWQKKPGLDQFAHFTDPPSPTGNTITSCVYSDDGLFLMSTPQGSPFLEMYSINENNEYTKINPFNTIPTGGSKFETRAEFGDGKNLIGISRSSTPFVNFYENVFENTISKSNNEISKSKHLGYALEDGTEGQEKTMMSLFRSST